jgi:transcriptional regulator with XRE-family HTH domain
MRGMTEKMTIGERVAFYRRRRGLAQIVLAGLVARTEDWLSRVENNKIEIDRLSVIRRIAEALDVTIGDLVGDPTLLEWTPESGVRTVPALRAALMDYRQFTPGLASTRPPDEPPNLDAVERDVAELFSAYQASRYGYLTGRAPLVLSDALLAVRLADDDAKRRGNALLALAYQASVSVLTKLGEGDLAWIASERGLAAAQQAENPSCSARYSDRSHTHCCPPAGSPRAWSWCRPRRMSCSRISAPGPTTRCCRSTGRSSLPAPSLPRAPTTVPRRSPSFVRLTSQPAGSAATGTRCGPPSGPRMSRFTA